MSAPDCLDGVALERLYRLGGATLVAGMIDAFLGAMPERVRAASAGGDLASLASAMHSLKSTAGNFGSLRVPPLAARLEQAALAGEGATVAGELPELMASLGELVARLEHERQRCAS